MIDTREVIEFFDRLAARSPSCLRADRVLSDESMYLVSGVLS